MQSIAHNPSLPTDLDLIGRLALAGLFAGLVGIERELSDQRAGFRTHILVGLGSCLFAIISAYGAVPIVGESAQVRVDPTRIAAQIVSGIGFLGAGAIIRNGLAVRGLTTAASLWVVAAIGMAAAFGSYTLAAFTTAFTLVSLFALKRFGLKYFHRARPGRNELVIDAGPALDIGEVVLAILDVGGRIDRLTLDDDQEGSPDGRRIHAVLTLTPGTEAAVLSAVVSLPGVRDLDISR